MDIPEKEFEPGGVFHDRGIDREVADERFVYYDHERCAGHPGMNTETRWHSWPCIQETFDVGERTFWELGEDEHRMIRNRVMQAPGIIMVRNRASEELPPVIPEMRPAWEVLTGKLAWHRHSPAKVKKSEAWQRHVAKSDPPDHPITELLKARYPRRWGHKLVSKSGGSLIVGRHGGWNIAGLHGHRRMARYLFSRQPDAESEWTHVHEADFTTRAYGSAWGAAKAEREHLLSPKHADIRKMKPATTPDGDFPGGKFRRIRKPDVKLPTFAGDQGDKAKKRREWIAEYWHTVKHSHTDLKKDSGTALAARLNISPKARELLAKIEGSGDGEVFIAMESCLKEAAIMTAILKEDRRATVFSYPSVTLYPDELDAFASEHFRGLRVWLVPDNDYASNQQVRTQAFAARERLRQAVDDAGGEFVHIAAPPLIGDDENGKPIKLGADDALGPLHGFTLDDFVVLDRPEPYGYAEWKWSQPGMKPHGRYADGDASQSAVFKWLVLFADDTGESTVTDRQLGRYAFPEEWADAEAVDLARGHDPETNRPHEQHRDTLRSKAGRAVAAMRDEKLQALTVTGEDLVLDDDGGEVRINGIPVRVKRRRINPDLWERFRGSRYRIGDA
ncbi:MAG: hypothetical protein M3P11_12925 [Actinomycetota bacterium]|nr:hypothetical protein [Actinomycetota bacterium]MDP9331526.1 hypothetical protein [Actinomycetota bacterium]